MVFEEFVLPAEVVLLDSFNTTNQSILVVGEEEDDFFGKTSATGYSRLSFNPDSKLPEAEAVLDSIFFQLNVRSVSGKNLDQAKSYTVHRLTEQILDTLYYNFDELSHEETAIAAGEVVFGEETDTLVSLQVTPEFAEEIFGELKNGIYFNDVFSFRNYFPGIVIKGKEGDNTSISVALGTNTGILAYYHNEESDTVSTSYNISASVKLTDNTGNFVAARSFTGIKSDRSGTPTDLVTETKKGYDVGPLVGLKAGLGMLIKLDTSPFDTFLDTLSGVTFNQVLLELGELEPQAETQLSPSNLAMYFVNSRNEILTTSTEIPYSVQADGFAQVLTDANGDNTPTTSTPTFLSYDPETRMYGQLITSHVNALFRDQLTRRDWFLYPDSPVVAGDDFTKSLRQFVVDKNKIKVKVIYSRSR